jgi:hypothetical protein
MEGTMSRKVCIPSKHATFGIKSFEFCEAKSCYVWSFIIYTGQDTVFEESTKNEPYGSKVVQLMTPLLNQGYCAIMANWFQTQICFLSCAANRLTLWEPYIKNRMGIPAEIMSAKLKEGELVSIYKDRLMIIEWINKKYICLISTTHDKK